MADIAANNSQKAIGFDDRLAATVTTELKAMNNMEGETQDGDKIIFGDIGDALLALKEVLKQISFYQIDLQNLLIQK